MAGGESELSSSLCRARGILGFRKDLGGEELDANLGVAPGVRGKAGLAARFFEQTLRVPSMLGSNLGKQQAARAAQCNGHTVDADLQSREDIGGRDSD